MNREFTFHYNIQFKDGQSYSDAETVTLGENETKEECAKAWRENEIELNDNVDYISITETETWEEF